MIMIALPGDKKLYKKWAGLLERWMIYMTVILTVPMSVHWSAGN